MLSRSRLCLKHQLLLRAISLSAIRNYVTSLSVIEIAEFPCQSLQKKNIPYMPL
jgi:hypothetical protein